MSAPTPSEHATLSTTEVVQAWRTHRSPIALALHLAILTMFVSGLAYTTWMVFWVMSPGVAGPLLDHAHDIPVDFMVKRRMYAIEWWVTFTGFALYLGLTEIVPRLKRARQTAQAPGS